MANRITKYYLWIAALVIVSCGISQETSKDSIIEYSVVKTAKDLDKLNQYDTVIVEGKLKYFKPWSGKGGGSQFFNFEIRLNQGGELPLYKTVIIGEEFLNKKVKVVGIYECEGMRRPGDIGVQDISVRRIQKILSVERLK